MTRAYPRGVLSRSLLLASVLVLLLLAWTASVRPADAQSGQLTGNLPSNGGLAIVFWGGGPVSNVQGAAAAGGCDAISTWTTHAGLFIGYIFGAPDFVNEHFLETTPDGDLAPSTGLILVCRGESSGAPPPSQLGAPNLSDYLPSTTELDAYRAAVALRDAGQYQQAAAAFTQIGIEGGAMAPAARLRAAQMLMLADDEQAAATAFGPAVADPGLPPALRVVGRIDAATVLRSLNRDAEAATMLEGVTAGSGANASQIAYAYWVRAQIQQSAGGTGWADLARHVVANYPWTPYARNALEALQQAGISVPPLEAAYVRYQHGENASALAFYQVVATSGAPADAAIAWFYIGALYERAGNNTAAIEAYRTSIDRNPTGRLAGDAHWWAAVLLSEDGNDSAAAEHYEALARTVPNSTFASDASIRAALIRVELGATQQAITELTSLIDNSSGYTAARAARWVRVLGGTAPDPASLHPRSIAAILDAAGDDADQPMPAALMNEGISTAAPDWSAAATWMQSRHGGAPGAPLATDQAMLRVAFGLNAAGETAVARTVLQHYLVSLNDRPYALLELARLAASAGMYDVSIGAAERLLSSLSPSERMQAPFAIERLAYPTPFTQEAIAAAQEQGVPPLLLMALVRRESTFRVDAVSSAGARGLTQVMPATGQEIAASLGVTWNQDMLMDPPTSLRFGAYYLSKQLDSFDGDVFGALAAYNAGPGNASRWFSEQPQDGADWYIETVSFGETRSYLRVVLEDYAWYRYIYDHAPRPAIR